VVVQAINYMRAKFWQSWLLAARVLIRQALCLVWVAVL
jgi:hypothetical protein